MAPASLSPSTFKHGGFIQFKVTAGDIEANLQKVTQGLAELGPDLTTGSTILVLPELWATGFAYPDLKELSTRTPEILTELQKLAARYDVYLAGSLPEQRTTASATNYHNTLYVTGPTGITGLYRKQRLFAPMREDSFFSPGQEPEPLRTPAGPLAALVCFDLRFPELARRQLTDDIPLLLVSAQWPMARLDHWQTLLKARAIENQVFVIAANSCGTTGDTMFGGHSMILAPDGTTLAKADDRGKSVMVGLDDKLLVKHRALFRTTMTS